MSRSQAHTGSPGGNEPPRRPNNAKDNVTKSHYDERFRVSKHKPADRSRYAGICLRCNEPHHGTRQAKDCDRACASCGKMEHFGTWCPEFQTKKMWRKYAYNDPPEEDKAIDLEQQLNDAQAETQKLMNELSDAGDDNENLELALQDTRNALVEVMTVNGELQRDLDTLRNMYLARGMGSGQMQNPPQQWFAPGYGYPPFGFASGSGSLQQQPGQPPMPLYPYPNMNEAIARAQFGPTDAYNQRGPIAYIGQQQPIQGYAPHPSIQQWAPLLQAHQQAPRFPTLSRSPAQLHHGDAHQAFQQPMQDGGIATVAQHQAQSPQMHEQSPQDYEPCSGTQNMASPQQLNQYTSPYPERSPQ
ncbi:uncharacterized protein LTHEOB_7695 [Lasiodiplodia theobromae]|uniref:uncharacterized protein n=1 Tax=Lasiodiplodia theobromae TaxID=45133 RepID=UPI0015C38D08|nr:uncharacterized protein LTHEOB_7695 [Lasiodiplodia theobromae]KAF4542503.1 hypothetical protein LTHEOB_7695 [Lasiodiplodia theobromae]